MHDRRCDMVVVGWVGDWRGGRGERRTCGTQSQAYIQVRLCSGTTPHPRQCVPRLAHSSHPRAEDIGPIDECDGISESRPAVRKNTNGCKIVPPHTRGVKCPCMPGVRHTEQGESHTLVAHLATTGISKGGGPPSSSLWGER